MQKILNFWKFECFLFEIRDYAFNKLICISLFVVILYRLPYFETSAKNGNNISKAIECLLDNVMLRMERSIDKSQFPGVVDAHGHGNGKGMPMEVDEAGERSSCMC